MAALDFPLNPTTTTEVTTGDITWKWNGYAWYAISEADTDLTDIFLSKVNDDTAAGEITFESKGLFEDGLYIQSRADFPGVDNGLGGAHFEVVPNGVTPVSYTHLTLPTILLV